jgi:hypothetical protein
MEEFSDENMNASNQTNSSIKSSIEFMRSLILLENTRRINVMSTIIFTLIGLIGHFLTIFVFAQKRFRKNSSNVYLLCLAINDAFYLIIHFFEVKSSSFLLLIDKMR